MKKNFLLAIAVMLMTAVSSFAQNEQKEYNMVITLNNGTTVTLGHNDIKDITFNDGEISISGDVVSTIDNLRDFTYYLDNKMMVVRDEQNTRIQELEDNMAKLSEDTYNKFSNMATLLGDTDKKFNNMATAVDENFAIYNDALNKMAATTDENFAIYNNALNEMASIMDNNINAIVAMIEQLHPEIANSPKFKAVKAAAAANKAKVAEIVKAAKAAAMKK